MNIHVGFIPQERIVYVQKRVPRNMSCGRMRQCFKTIPLNLGTCLYHMAVSRGRLES